jgi:hypothetical protein
MYRLILNRHSWSQKLCLAELIIAKAKFFIRLRQNRSERAHKSAIEIVVAHFGIVVVVTLVILLLLLAWYFFAC